MKFNVCMLAMALLLSGATTTDAYPVANAVTLDELAEHSDVIFKGTLLRGDAVVDDSFRKTHGFDVHESVFRVVSVLKGDIKPGSEIRFRHFLEDDSSARMFMPQHFSFDMNGNYIVCAKKVVGQEHLRQIWDSHRGKEDQGSLRCIDDKPHIGESLRDAYWAELQKSIQSDKKKDILYAIGQLNAMSRGNHSSHKSFDRPKTVDLIMPLIDSDDDEIAHKVIKVIGGENPALGGNIWALIRANPTHFPGYALAPETPTNFSAKTHSDVLLQVANSTRSAKLRKIAILSLANTQNAMLLDHAARWATDADPEIRSAAAILLADFAKDVPVETWETLLSDQSAIVRVNATRAVAIGQVTPMIGRVTKLLGDEDEKVVAGAAACLLAFPIDKSRETLISQIKHPQYACLFVNALATENPAKYTDELGQTIRTDPKPKAWWGGHVPWGVAWSLLFKYAQSQSAAQVRAGDFDKILDALESPVREFEQSNHYSSSEPRDLYAFYIQRGMKKRAKDYRKVVNEKTRYDMELYFKRVDEHPSHFMRN